MPCLERSNPVDPGAVHGDVVDHAAVLGHQEAAGHHWRLLGEGDGQGVAGGREAGPGQQRDQHILGHGHLGLLGLTCHFTRGYALAGNLTKTESDDKILILSFIRTLHSTFTFPLLSTHLYIYQSISWSSYFMTLNITSSARQYEG